MSLEEAITLANDEQFAHARKTVLKLVEAIRKNVHEALLFVHEDWLPLFKEKERDGASIRFTAICLS